MTNPLINAANGVTIPVLCAHTHLIPIDKVLVNPSNVKVHPPDQLRLYCAVILGNGWRRALVVSDRSGLLVKGHGGLMAAKKMGCDVVPVEIQHYENDAEELADRLADNRLAELGSTDNDKLKEALLELDTLVQGEGAIEASGFTEKEIENLMTASVPPPGADEGSGGGSTICPSCGFQLK